MGFFMYKKGDNITWTCNISNESRTGVIIKAIAYDHLQHEPLYKVLTDDTNEHRWVSEELIIESS